MCSQQKAPGLGDPQEFQIEVKIASRNDFGKRGAEGRGDNEIDRAVFGRDSRWPPPEEWFVRGAPQHGTSVAIQIGTVLREKTK
jgi:hypothetical protein